MTKHCAAQGQTPLRILHVVGRMDRAGIETWLMHVFRHVDRERFQMDFLVHDDKPGQFDSEIRKLGGSLINCSGFRRFWEYGKRFQAALKNCVPYDIIHSHMNALSGFPLKYAEDLRIPIRIAHCHSDLLRMHASCPWSKRVILNHSRKLVTRHATHGLAASETAADSLFARDWRADVRWRVLPCGIDLSPLPNPISRQEIKQEFSIPADAVVIGHVGRFVGAKNHIAIVDIATALADRTDKFHLVLVGDGEQKNNIQNAVEKRGLSRHFTFTGVRTDVPRLFASLFDAFLFPSLYEGLGLVVIEAIAAGCPAIISDVIPNEVDLVCDLVTRVPLSCSPEHWAGTILETARKEWSPTERTAARMAVAQSPFNIVNGVWNLTELYSKQVDALRAA